MNVFFGHDDDYNDHERVMQTSKVYSKERLKLEGAKNIHGNLPNNAKSIITSHKTPRFSVAAGHINTASSDHRLQTPHLHYARPVYIMTAIRATLYSSAVDTGARLCELL